MNEIFKITILTISLISSLSTLGQRKSSDLLNESAKNTRVDTADISLLMAYAKTLSTINPDTAIILLRDLITKCDVNSNQMQAKHLNKEIKLAYTKKTAEITKYLAQIYSEYKEDKKKGLVYFEEAKKIYMSINDSVNVGLCLYEKASINSQLGNIREALANYSKALKIFENTDNKKLIARSLNGIAVIYKNQGQVKEALSHYTRSLKIFEQIKDKNGLAGALSNIGVVYKSQDQLPEAIDYYRRSLKLYREVDNKKGQGKVLSNIGSIFFLQKQTDSALIYFKQSLEISELEHDKIGMASSLNNLGGVYYEKNQLDEALKCIKKSLVISQSINNKSGVAKSCSSISDIYLRKNELNNALEYGLMSLKLSKELGYPFIIKASALNLKTIYKKQNNSKKALEMFELYHVMADSISNQETKEISYKSKLQYEYTKKKLTDSLSLVNQANEQKANFLIELKEQKQLLQLYVFSTIFLVAIFLFILFYRNYIYTKRSLVLEKKYSIQLIEEMEKEKHRIARELHDGVNQNLIVAKRQANKIGDNTVATMLDGCIEEIRQISREMLPVYIKQESLKFSLVMLINKIESSTNMLISYYIEDIEFNDNVKLHLYRIAQECINNSLKHSNANSINIQLKKSNSITLQIEDDGDGFLVSDTNTESFGLITIKQRALAIGASIHVESKLKEGTKITIKL